MMREAFRVLRPGGLSIHSVNCADHYAYFDHNVSPINYLNGVRAHVYLMHDQDDPFIPFSQSRELANTGRVAGYTEFSIFSHVIPDRPVPHPGYRCR